MFKMFKASNPSRGFRNVISSPLVENPEMIIVKAELEDFNNKTKIKVNLGEAAVFIVNGKVEQVLGPSMEAVEVANYPFFSNFKAMFYGGSRTTSCSVYYVRTGDCQSPLLWGTPGQMPFVDPKMNNTRFYVGGSGSFNIKVKLEDTEKLIDYASIGGHPSFSYEQLSMKLNPLIAEQFRNAIKADMLHGQNYDTPNQDLIAQTMSAGLRNTLSDQCGLLLTMFTVDNLALTDSPERERLRTIQVDKVEVEQTQDLDDRGERKALFRKALEEQIIRQAAAKGKLKELELLGDQFWKIRLSELAETALTNPSIANMGSSALGGYLGANTDILNNLIGSLGNIMSGNQSQNLTSSKIVNTSKESEDMSSDFWSVPEEDSSSSSFHVVSETSSDSQEQKEEADDSSKLNMIKTYTQLLVSGKISQQQFEQLIKDL